MTTRLFWVPDFVHAAWFLTLYSPDSRRYVLSNDAKRRSQAWRPYSIYSNRSTRQIGASLLRVASIPWTWIKPRQAQACFATPISEKHRIPTLEPKGNRDTESAPTKRSSWAPTALAEGQASQTIFGTTRHSAGVHIHHRHI